MGRTREILTFDQARALTLLAAGRTNFEAAKITGLSIRTIEKWRALPHFKKLLTEAVCKLYEAAIAELTLDAREAAQELKNIINSPDTPIKVKLQAINILFTHASKFKSAELEERLENLERAIEDGDYIGAGTESGEEDSEEAE